MLEQFSDQVRECYERAAEAKECADATNDLAIKAEFLAAEKRWLTLARSYGFTERLGDFTAANSERRRNFDVLLRAKIGSTPETRSEQLSDDRIQIHEIDTLLIEEGNLDSLYNRIVDAATALMSSDMASLQLLDPERSQLRLLAWKGFHPQSASFWEWVYLDSASTCGLALSTGCRVMVSDIETDVMAGTPDLDAYRRSNIRAVQSTPLVSRSGELLGMISTHWHEPHQPTASALRRLDVLARQVADLIERSRTAAALALRNDAATVLAKLALRNDAATLLADTPFLITRCSSDLRYLFVSEACARMLGHRSQEVVGKKTSKS
jgi:PAS domain-containing protein